MVMTQDDYYHFLAQSGGSQLPTDVRRALADSNLMLLGFRSEDWSFPLLLNYLFAQAPSGLRRRYSHVTTEMSPEDSRTRRYVQDYLSRSAEIDIYWGSPEDFLQDLAKNLSAQQP
jgi:hypothetical protein